MRRRIAGFVVLLGFIASAGAGRAQTPDTATARIRALFHADEYEAAAAAGAALARGGAVSPEARAWTIAALAADQKVDEALKGVRLMQRLYPTNRWTGFANAQTLLAMDDAGAVEAAARARKAAPWDPELVALHATTLLRGSPRPFGPRAALVLLDSAATRSRPDATLAFARALAELSMAYGQGKPDTSAFRRTLNACDDALRLDPARAGAWSLKASILNTLGSPGQALEAAKMAVAIAPGSVALRRALWGEIARRTALKPEQKGEEIAADLDAAARVRGRTPGLLLAAARTYAKLKLADRQQVVEAELRRDYPHSWEVEQLDLDALEALVPMRRTRGPDTTASHAELLRRARAFVAQPGHSPRALGRAYVIELDALSGDTTTPILDLARVTEGAARYGQPYLAEALTRLAEHPETRDVARRLAPRIPAIEDAQIVHFTFVGDSTAALRRKRMEEMSRSRRGSMHDILGWVAFNEGRLGEATRELTLARKLAPRSDAVSYHFARLEERRGHYAEAEKLYADNLGSDRYLGGHPNADGLRRMIARWDSTPGAYDRFIAQREADRKARQEAEKEKYRRSVLAERIANPEPVPALTLARLDGGTFSSEELKGKVGIINFWGTWCAPCVQEMPLIQRLYERYRNSPDVFVVTIDEEHDAADPRKVVADFVAARKLTFPVMLADSSTSALVLSWPTTWYVDRQGRIAYEQRGAMYATADPVEPFVWPIESLRDTTGLKPAPGPAAARDSAAAKAAPGLAPAHGAGTTPAAPLPTRDVGAAAGPAPSTPAIRPPPTSGGCK